MVTDVILCNVRAPTVVGALGVVIFTIFIPRVPPAIATKEPEVAMDLFSNAPYTSARIDGLEGVVKSITQRPPWVLLVSTERLARYVTVPLIPMLLAPWEVLLFDRTGSVGFEMSITFNVEPSTAYAFVPDGTT
jgi:hypothetical protein